MGVTVVDTGDDLLSRPQSRRADIQGLRALAVVLVVGFHVRGWIPGGFLGVDVFFVISGFVITSMLIGRRARGAELSVGGFFGRRVRRLLPMLALTLTVTSLAGVLLLSPLGAAAVTAKTGIAAAVINANTFLSRQSQDYFALPVDANALVHTWSLSVEEQFYLVVPFVVLGVGVLARRSRRQPSRAAAAAVVAAAASVSFALFVATAGGGGAALFARLGVSSPQAFAFYAAPTRAWEFLAGAATALLAPMAARLAQGLRTAIGIVGLVGVVGSALLVHGAQGVSGAAVAVPVLATMAVLAAGTGTPTPSVRILSHPAATAVGDVSYGWYLFHWPLIVFVEANLGSAPWVVVAALASLALAFAAKRPIEDRFRHEDRWGGRRTVALAAVCVVVPVVAGAAAVVADRVLRVDDLAAAGTVHIDSEDCNRRLAEPVELDDPICTWAVPEARGSIVLIGDSHASMWSEAVIAAGNDLGYDVHVATMSGCPMVGGTLRRLNGREDPDCQRFISDSVEQIQRIDPALVVVGTGSTGVLSIPDGDAWRATDGSWTDDPARIATIWEDGLRSTLGAITDAGVPVVLLHEVPYHRVTTATCGRLLFMAAPARCASDLTLDEVAAQREVPLALEDRIDEADDRVATIDPLPWLCDDRACSTYRDETWMYRDRDHLSVAGSELLTDRMREAFVTQGL